MPAAPITEQQALALMTNEELFKIIDLNAYCIGSLDPERLTPTVVDYAMSVNNAVFYHIPRDKITPFCARFLAAHDCCRFSDLPAVLVTSEVQTLALQKYPLLLLTSKLIEINEKNCVTAYNSVAWGFLENVKREDLWQPRRLERLSQISRHLLSRNPRLFRWIINPTEEEILIALKVNPHLLSTMERQTFKMCWTACRQSPECAKYVLKKCWAGEILRNLLRREVQFTDPFTLVAEFV